MSPWTNIYVYVCIENINKLPTLLNLKFASFIIILFRIGAMFVLFRIGTVFVLFLVTFKLLFTFLKLVSCTCICT